jgi:hypothetical protein
MPLRTPSRLLAGAYSIRGAHIRPHAGDRQAVASVTTRAPNRHAREGVHPAIAGRKNRTGLPPSRERRKGPQDRYPNMRAGRSVRKARDSTDKVSKKYAFRPCRFGSGSLTWAGVPRGHSDQKESVSATERKGTACSGPPRMAVAYGVSDAFGRPVESGHPGFELTFSTDGGVMGSWAGFEDLAVMERVILRRKMPKTKIKRTEPSAA